MDTLSSLVQVLTQLAESFTPHWQDRPYQHHWQIGPFSRFSRISQQRALPGNPSGWASRTAVPEIDGHLGEEALRRFGSLSQSSLHHTDFCPAGIEAGLTFNLTCPDLTWPDPTWLHSCHFNCVYTVTSRGFLCCFFASIAVSLSAAGSS
ncbi:hypothetical protein GGR56DRAFT_584450 [Xylariaceae sp. FL0804]|nr:hypothetical protein GGR56DRAFT_584450 [Xylariaceae sp. FL0804]